MKILLVMKKHFILLLLLVPFCLNGCSSSTTPVPAHRSSCSFLTKATAEELLGSPMSQPQEQANTNGASSLIASNCTFSSQDPQNSSTINVLVRYGEPGEKKADPIAFHQEQMRTYLGEGYTLERIEGLADGAGWDGSLQQLTVFKGSTMIIITLAIGERGDPQLENAKRVAQEVLKNL